MSTTYTVEPLKTAASVLENKDATIKLWANGILTGTLDQIPEFLAFCELFNYGPNNDYNGKRSVARALQLEINTEIIIPAEMLFRILKDRA